MLYKLNNAPAATSGHLERASQRAHSQWHGHRKALQWLGLALATVRCEIKGSGNDTGEEQQQGLLRWRETFQSSSL